MLNSGLAENFPTASELLPTLRYVEYHLVEHCNLSCQRCGHFSPLAKPAFSDPEAFARDLRQLATHFSTIKEIRLLGGEPLLHPTPEAFVDIAHEISPNSDLRIVTNGTLLKSMRDSFWEACRRADVTLDFSMYPIMEKGRTQLEELCAREHVKINVNRYTTFLAGINPRGDSDPDKSMKYCRKQFYCPFLSNSRLYVCGLPATVHYFNDKFNRTIPDDPGIDIFDPALDGHRILQLLETPVETCRFCSCLYEAHPWKSIRVHQAEEYEVSQVTRDRVASDGGLRIFADHS
jgi:hypothetical protein